MTIRPRPREFGFGVFFQAVNSSTVWNTPESGSQTDFDSFRRLAETAERGLFRAFFLGEGLRLREHLGRIHDLDVAGRPDALTQLSALAAVTERLGLVATLNTTYHDVAPIAHRLSTLDLLSGGRAGWNVVTTDNAWTGANFRRGGYLDHADRYRHAQFVLSTVRELWDAAPEPGGPDDAGEILEGAAVGRRDGIVEAADAYGGVRIRSRLPRSPQEHPVIFQAGDSPEGRDFAARNAEVVFTAHPGFDEAVAYARDLETRLAAAGRSRDEVRLYPSAEIIVAPTADEAEEQRRWVREHQIGPQTAIAYLEQLWGTDLSAYDPDGPLPDVDPVSDSTGETRGTMLHGRRAKRLADSWRERAGAQGLSIRQFVAQLADAKSLVGSAVDLAARIERYLDAGAADGFIVSPYLVPSGLDDIVELLIPELRERGIYPSEYAGDTLRDNLALPAPLTRR